MSRYIHFTDEEKQRANSVDLVDFLRHKGEQLIRSGREWRWKRHDSVTVRGNQWFRHSSKQGGLAIDFVQEFYGLSFPEAVLLLLGGEQGIAFKHNSDNEAVKHRGKKFILPEASPNMNRVYAYLLKQRYIDREVITHFVREKKIFEDKQHHNAVFVGLDENGTPRHAHKRGTCFKDSGYRGNVEGSDPKYSFSHIGTSDTLYVFEAPIDMLSYITLHQKGWQQHSYVALDGVAQHAMLHVLSQNRHISNVILCLDNDAAGIEATGRLAEILSGMGYDRISYLQCEFKDWNESLKAQYGIAPIPAQKHPKIEACGKLCKELGDLCSMNPNKSPHESMMEHYIKYSSIIQNPKREYGMESNVTDGLKKIASCALLAVKEQHRQLEKPVTMEQLTGWLLASYHPHQDREKMSAMANSIKKDITAVNNNLNMVGIRTLTDREKLISAYMRLALDCVKAHISICLTSQEYKIKAEQKKNSGKTDNKQAAYEGIIQPQFNI